MNYKKRSSMKRLGQRLPKPVISLAECKGILYCATADGVFYLRKNRWNKLKIDVKA